MLHRHAYHIIRAIREAEALLRLLRNCKQPRRCVVLLPLVIIECHVLLGIISSQNSVFQLASQNRLSLTASHLRLRDMTLMYLLRKINQLVGVIDNCQNVVTYRLIPSKAIIMPTTLCIEIGRSLTNHPKPTMMQVFKCPITVLLTGPTALMT